MDFWPLHICLGGLDIEHLLQCTAKRVGVWRKTEIGGRSERCRLPVAQMPGSFFVV